MSEPLVYRECHFTRTSGTLSETVGIFVIGIPSKAIEEYRQGHPTDTIDAAFRSLVSKKEIEQMKDIFGFMNLSRDEQYPFSGDLLSLGAPTFEGEDGRKFWNIISKPTDL
jgi:hypothetical protein